MPLVKIPKKPKAVAPLESEESLAHEELPGEAAEDKAEGEPADKPKSRDAALTIVIKHIMSKRRRK